MKLKASALSGKLKTDKPINAEPATAIDRFLIVVDVPITLVPQKR
ncbi:hypothetical protein OSCI_3460091 [Kamptonema sp. PCC 6506]|nr:hypothetical protein OSCI_3460091 [Kamptonema sp. PCC 6506]